jgi:hypothetical protein
MEGGAMSVGAVFSEATAIIGAVAATVAAAMVFMEAVAATTEAVAVLMEEAVLMEGEALTGAALVAVAAVDNS